MEGWVAGAVSRRKDKCRSSGRRRLWKAEIDGEVNGRKEGREE